MSTYGDQLMSYCIDDLEIGAWFQKLFSFQKHVDGNESISR